MHKTEQSALPNSKVLASRFWISNKQAQLQAPQRLRAKRLLTARQSAQTMPNVATLNGVNKKKKVVKLSKKSVKYGPTKR